MPKLYELDGKQYQMPDDVTDEEALDYLGKVNAPPLWNDVIKEIPGVANRGVVKGVAGITRALGDLTGSTNLQELGQSVHRGVEAETAERTPPNMTFMQEAATSGLSSAAQMVPVAAAAGIGTAVAGLTGPAALVTAMGAGTTAMGAQTGFQRYGDIREAGFTPMRAGLHGMFEGLVEKYTEYIPMKELLVGNKFVQEAKKYFVKEMGGEQIATLLQDISAKLSDQPDMTLGDYAHHAALTAVSTPIAGAAQYGAFKGVGALLPTPVGGGITLENSEGAPPLPPMAVPPPATVPEVPPASLSPEVGPTSIKDLLGTEIPGTATQPAAEARTLATIRLVADNDTQDIQYKYHGDGTLERVSVAEVDGATTTQRFVTNAEGVNVWEQVINGQTVMPAVHVPFVDAGPIARADIASLRSEEPGQPAMEAAIHRQRPAPVRESRASQAQRRDETDNEYDDEYESDEDAEVMEVSQARPLTATGAPPVIKRTFGDREISNEYTTYGAGGRPRTLMLPDPEHNRLRHLGRLLADRRVAKTDKRRAKLSIEIDSLRQEVANHFGFASGEVDGLAESYYQAVRDKSHQGAKTIGTVFDELRLPTQGVTPAVEIQPEQAAPAIEVLPGKVYIAPELQNDPYAVRSAKYLEGWARVFSPNMKIAITEVMPTAVNGQRPMAGATRYENGVHYVRLGSLNPKVHTKNATVILDLAHEFGHMLMAEHLQQPRFGAALRQMKADHAALVAKIPTMTVEEFLTEWSNPGFSITFNELNNLVGVARNEPAQVLVDKVNALMGDPTYFLSFDEYAAEQFSRYVNAHQKISFPDDLKSMWDSVVETVKEFYTKVVKKLAPSKTYEKFVDDLRVLAKVSEAMRGTPEAMQRGNEHAAVDLALASITGNYNYTLKVLSRLPKKEMVKKATVLAELGRKDVNPQEREIIEDVLHEMPDVMSRELLEYQALLRVTELRLQTLYNTQYNPYGWDRLQFAGPAMQYSNYENESPVQQRKQRMLLGYSWAETHIWQVPFYTGPNRHFPEAQNYWAHTRVLLEDGGRTIGEVQSDIEQDKTTVDDLRQEQFVLRQFADDVRDTTTLEDLDWLNRKLRGIKDSNSIWINEYESREQFFADWEKDRQEILEQVERAVERLETREEAQQDLEAAAMPSKWFRVVLRSETIEAAKNGEKWVRIPSVDSLIAFEGWPSGRRAGEYQIGGLVDFVAPGGVLTGKIEISEIGSVELETKTGAMLPLNQMPTLVANILVQADIPRELNNPKHQAIADKYRREIIPFVNKEFGAKYTTDQWGQTWWQWEVNPEIASVPIEYFQADLANASAVENLAATAELPSIPRAFAHVQDVMQSLLQLNQMAKILPNVEGLQVYRRLMQSMHNLKNSLMEQPNQQIERWHSMNLKQAELTEDALRDEEREGAHWTTVVQDTAVDNMGNQKLVWVHQANPEFLTKMEQRGIRKEGVHLFLSLKNDFMRVLQTMEETLLKSVKEFYAGNYVLQQAKLIEVEREFATLRTIPYLPDTRFGNYSVQVRAGYAETVDGREIKKNELVYYEKFESQKDRDKRFEELKRAYGKAHKVVKFFEDDTVASMQMMPRTFVETAIAVLNSNPDTALTADQMDLLIQTQYDFTATGKFEKYLKAGRKGVGGAEKDLRRVYANYMWRTANSISKMQYGKSLQAAVADVKQEALQTRKETGDSTPLDKLHAYLSNNFQYVMKPQNEWQGLRAFVSLWYLIGSPKTALMNFMSVPVLSYSYLGARYGDTGAIASLVKATKTVAQFWRDPSKVPVAVRLVLQQAKADGVTDQSFAAMLANIAEGGVALEKLIPKYGFLKSRKASDAARKLTWRITSMGMAPFRVVEQINRMVTLVATYELEAKKLGAKAFSQDAYQAARDAVDYTQNEFSPWNRPTFMQGKKGIFLIFYSFVQNMAFMLFGGDKGWWRALMVLMAMGGLQGLPGMENILDVLNWSARKMTGKNVDLRTEAREVAEHIGMNPDLVMHGFSHSTFGLGWDVSSSAGVGRLIPGTDAVFGVGKFEHRFMQGASEIGGPAGSLAISFLQALADDNPNMLLRFDRVLPPALRNVERATMAAQQSAWTDTKGNPIVRDPTAVELIGQAFGFAPTRKSQVQERLRVERDAVQYYTVSRQVLLATMHQARRSGELEAFTEAQEAIKAFNDRVPFKEMRISQKDVAQSMKSRNKAEDEALNNDSPQKRYQRMYDAIGPYYNLDQL